MSSEVESWLDSKEGPKRSLKSEKAWSSVAFQAHLDKQYNISFPKINPHPRNGHRATKHSTRSLTNGNSRSALIKGAARPPRSADPEQEYSLREGHVHQLSLAQKLGLVERPPSLLTEEEWQEIKRVSNKRLDSTNPCPICKDSFHLQAQLLLSCSHIFHRSCMESYERFVRQRVCPVCRCEQYQARVVYEGARHTRERAAVLIQSRWRGHRARLEYAKLQEMNPPKHPSLRKKFFSHKLSQLTDQYMEQCVKREHEIDRFIDELNNTLGHSRRTLASLDQHLGSLAPDQWVGIRDRAMDRGEHECPICLAPLFGSKEVSLLSCSHLFHTACLQSFEEFANYAPFACPVCRSTYQKIQVTQ